MVPDVGGAIRIGSIGADAQVNGSAVSFPGQSFQDSSVVAVRFAERRAKKRPSLPNPFIQVFWKASAVRPGINCCNILNFLRSSASFQLLVGNFFYDPGAFAVHWLLRSFRLRVSMHSRLLVCWLFLSVL